MSGDGRESKFNNALIGGGDDAEEPKPQKLFLFEPINRESEVVQQNRKSTSEVN